MNRRFTLGAIAAAIGCASLGLPGKGWAVPVFMNGEASRCGGDNTSSLVYRIDPGPTSVGSDDGPVAGSGAGNYGWISGCASVATGLGYTVLGSFANGGSFTGVTAIGNQATGGANFATAHGTESLARGVASMALGAGSTATGKNPVSIGGGGASVLSVADSTTASGDGSIAMGVNATKGAQAAATDSIALGGQSSVAAGATSGIAIGRGATTQGTMGIAMGDGVVSGATGNNVAIGSDGTTANSLDASGGAVAIGRGQKATGNGAVAIGDPNVANGTGAVALGADNTAAGDAGGTVAADGAVAIGNANSALGTGNIAIGSNSTASGTGATAMGVGANAGASNAIALGTGATAGQAGAVALGAGSVTAAAVGTASTVIGGITYNFAGTTPASTVSVGAPGAERTITNVAAGQLSATSTDAINGSQLLATNLAVQNIRDVSGVVTSRWVLGSPTTYVAPASSGTNSTAIGSGAIVSANNSVAVGTGATAATDNSVALGNDSTTAAGVASPGVTLRGTTYAFAGANPAGVVSLGSAGAERQLQNVAAGQISATSTDAINGSQLYGVNQAITGVNTVVNAGINVTTASSGTGVANGTSIANVAPGGTATYTAGNNIVMTQTGTNVAFAVNPNPSFTSVRIIGGPSLTSTGIDAGGKAVTNVGAGVNGTDAVTLNQVSALGGVGAGLQNYINDVGRNP